MFRDAYIKLSILLFLAVGTSVTLYARILFGGDEYVVLLKAYISAIVFGTTAIGSKLLSSDYPKGPRRFEFAQSHSSVGILLSYGGIIGIAALFGVLLYVDNIFDPTEHPFSFLLYYSSHALVGFITAVIVTMSWIVSSKL